MNRRRDLPRVVGRLHGHCPIEVADPAMFGYDRGGHWERGRYWTAAGRCITIRLMRKLIFWLGMCLPAVSPAADAVENIPSLAGSWEGAIVIGQDSSNLAFTFSETNGGYRAALISSAMGIYGMPAQAIELDGLRLVIRMPRIDGVFTGRLRLDESGKSIERIDGDWFQYAEMLPLTLLPVDAPAF